MIETITEAELPEKQRALFQKAKTAIGSQNHSYAVNLLKALLKECPGFLDGRKLLRNSAIKAVGGKKKKGGLFSGMKKASVNPKKPVESLNSLEDALESDPFSEVFNNQLYELAMAINQPDLAAFALETVRAGKPENTKILHKLADHYLARDMSEEAIGVYRDILEVDPTDGDAVKGEKDASARASMKKQNWEKADGMASLMRNSDEQKAQAEKGRTGLTREQLEQRLAGLYEKYNEDNQNLAISKEIANTAEQLEDWETALTFYEWAYSLSSGDSALKDRASKVQEKLRESKIRDLETQLAAEPNNEDLRQQLEQLKAETAAQQVEECKLRVEQNPTDPQLRFDLGSALFYSGNPSEAIPQLQRARNNPHIRTKAMLLLGKSYESKKMYDLAVKTLADALEELHVMDGTKKEVLYTRGCILQEMGRNDEALENFKVIYDADYGYRDVAERVESSYA